MIYAVGLHNARLQHAYMHYIVSGTPRLRTIRELGSGTLQVGSGASNLGSGSSNLGTRRLEVRGPGSSRFFGVCPEGNRRKLRVDGSYILYII